MGMNPGRRFRGPAYYGLLFLALVALCAQPSSIIRAQQEQPPTEQPPGEQPPGERPAVGDEPVSPDSTVRPEEPEPSFEDEVSTREVSAAQAIAEIERRKRARESARSLSQIRNLISFEFHDMTGATDADILSDAGVRALTSAASQLYFGDYILIGRDVLEPYLRNYGDRFIVRRTILGRRILPNGQHALDVRVGVNADTFYRDLEEKHFVAKPKIRPIMAVVLEEIVDGQPSSEGIGRKILEEVLRKNEMRVESEKMGPYPLHTDATKTAQSLQEARNEAQRGEVEVLITGSVRMNKRDPRKVLYDDFAFYDGRIDLKLLRVDTGEVLAESSQSYSSFATAREGSPDGAAAQQALTRAYQDLVPRAATELTGTFLSDWQRRMLDNADFRLMVTGASEEQLASVFNMLKTLSPQVEAYVKSFYADVAVINIFFPGGTTVNLEEFLRKSRVPQFRVHSEDARRFELRVL